MKLRPAPPWQISDWLNTPQALSLEALKGRIIVLEAFQMLCPGCVSHGLPQARRIAAAFAPEDVMVIGLHTVFEHYEAQGSRVALEAFLHEYRFDFPVGIDAQGGDGILPQTMNAYQMQGTPTLVLIDQLGRRRAQHFGSVEDLRLGAQIGALMAEAARLPEVESQAAGCVPPP
ncbi:TlpA family protein disulfide reductase [uncultured Maricaulis sp.]|uniref:TlpA family protein disulfide reductase n=1 Tax=uncultured Maricaulis sp. TaxID=174710 RepID=UPI0030D970B7